MKEFDNISVEKLLEYIESRPAQWGGYSNGDNETKYQGRKLKEIAAVLILIGREMEFEKPFLNEEEAKDLFFNHVRGLGKEYLGNHSNDGINLTVIPNLWKMIH